MHKSNSKFKLGFTLAEVLVTLMIIGVVASMTIPGLKKTAEEQSYVTGAQKAYSTLTSATKMVKLKNGHIVTWPLKKKESILNLYKSQMNVTEMPNIASTKYAMSYLNNNSYAPADIFNNTSTFYTADGMLWYIVSSDEKCSTGKDSSLFSDACLSILVDINGPKKPNVIGVDIFAFYITKEAVIPFGTSPKGEQDLSTCSNSSTGFACTTKILSDGKISW